ncbi:Mov34/MPN/PAD-1 family protein [Nocardioides sp. B-3]|uniref:Mov34/MPN/PAD-1 family protein n=1 Tax=Nocardioides sp. B-3 TaxID=2895565 RepID=UPI0021534EF2|nr:Mov34/MPN/PAD-1 family protein [Nocardioides sp. B-3]UUZ60560.1 Mov34/MPN/PAD-1 family protein [Nocardioides sp. B-3]
MLPGTTEHGGILVGYRTPNGLHIEDALVVDDGTAARTHYVRRAKPAQQILVNYLAISDPLIGYVGEWHTHPLPQPPSPRDRRTMRLMAMRNSNPVALVVAALNPGTRHVRLHGLLSDPHPASHRLLGKFSDITIAPGE